MSHYAVYLKGSEDSDPVYKNYNGDQYCPGEIIAVFGENYDAAKWFAANFKGYSENGIAEICGCHPGTQVGQDRDEFWSADIPSQVKEAWEDCYRQEAQKYEDRD